MNDTLQNFATNLRKLRVQQNLTQEQLANMLNYSKKSVSKWESGQALPPSVILPELSKLLKTTIDDMMSPPRKIKYYLGIAGYDTRTDFALASSDGKIIATATLGNSNPTDVGAERMKKILSDGIFKLLEDISFNNISVFAGIDGIYNTDKSVLMDFLSNFGFAKVKCGSTLQSSVKTTFGKGQGVFVAARHGSIVMAISNGDVLARVGGYGYLFDEPFCLYTLGKSVVSAALRYEDGSGEYTLLTELLQRELKASITPRQYFRGLDHTELSRFAPLIFEAYKKGDAIAARILKSNVEELARGIKIVARHIGNAEIPVSICGSLTQFEDCFLPMLKKHLSDDSLNYSVSISQIPAVQGALILAGLSEVIKDSQKNI